MSTHSDLDGMARRVIDTNHYMTLGTCNDDGSPHLSPVYYAHARHADFYWVSSPQSRHSHNIDQRPEIEIVIFDSTAPVGEGEAVYVAASAERVAEQRHGMLWAEAFRPTAGARRFTPEELHESGMCLYVAHARSFEVHVPGGHPAHGRGVDTRQPADPTGETPGRGYRSPRQRA